MQTKFRSPYILYGGGVKSSDFASPIAIYFSKSKHLAPKPNARPHHIETTKRYVHFSPNATRTAPNVAQAAEMGDIGLFQKLSSFHRFERCSIFWAQFTPRGKGYKRYVHYSLNVTFGFFYIVDAATKNGKKLGKEIIIMTCSRKDRYRYCKSVLFGTRMCTYTDVYSHTWLVLEWHLKVYLGLQVLLCCLNLWCLIRLSP